MNVVWSHPAYEEAAQLVRIHAGLSFPSARQRDIEAGVQRVMAAVGVQQVAEFVKRLRQQSLFLDDLIDELTVGETYFFRDPAHFDFIRREIIPDVRRRRGGNHRLRVWSAGCASGEEPYSLAILLEEEMEAASSTVVATDISRTALARARTASYGAWSFRGDAGDLKNSRHFRPRGPRYVLTNRFRRRVAFDYLNLALDTYPSLANGIWGCDLILCRNVLIYFDRQTVRGVARRLYDSLAPGGWLITGASDPALNEFAPFEIVLTESGIFHRRPLETPASEAPPALVAPAPAPPRPRPAPVASPRAQAPAKAPARTPAKRHSAARPKAASTPAPSPIEAARKAFDEGQYARVIELTRNLQDDQEACALGIRSLANLGEAASASRAAASAVTRHSLATDLHFLRAVVLVAMGDLGEAVDVVNRALYLDRSLIVGHLLLGSILVRIGDRPGAKRAYRNAQQLASALPPEAPVPLAEGEQAERLAELAQTHLDLLIGNRGTSP